MPAQLPDPTWKARVWAEYRAGNLSRTERDVLLVLHGYRGTGGACWPAHTTLAERARCSVRSVQRALTQGRDLDLVHWHERRMRRGWRWLRTSNAYRLRTPAGDVRPGQRKPAWKPFPTTGHNARRVENQTKKEGLQEMLQQAARLPDLLAARRQTFERHATVAA